MLEYSNYEDDELKIYWEALALIQTNCNDEIEQDFHFFPAGTPKEDIWQWFDEKHSKGVHALLHPCITNPKTAEGFFIKWGFDQSVLALGYADDLDLTEKGLIPELQAIVDSHITVNDLGGLDKASDYMRNIVNSGISLTSRELVIHEAIDEVLRIQNKIKLAGDSK